MTGGAFACLLWGFRRAMFANESGLGTAPIAFSAVNTNKPVAQAFISMLQPFVENSIYHGLKNLEDEGIIDIKVYKEDDFLYYVVKDNGYGMRQSKIDELYERMRNDDVTNSVGIKNVYQRLKLYFGDKADIIIESELDEYTKFIIKTPIIKEELE
jgi:sensor histidine kinase YesM